MSKNGLTIDEGLVISGSKEKKKSLTRTSRNRSSPQQGNYQDQYLDLTEELQACDSDSGVSLTRKSIGKVAVSVSGTNLASDDDLDDDERLLERKNSSLTTSDDQDRRGSDSSSITNFTINKTSSEFQLNSKASSRASGINLPPLITPTNDAKLRKPVRTLAVPTNVPDSKGKHGVRKFIQKIFKSSSSSSSSSRSPGNQRSTGADSPKGAIGPIGATHGATSLPLGQASATQGPIRLLVLRHGERLDRYYSSQWLRQAFDKDGNFCRFSPILPETLPFRASIRDFDLDPPLTYKGLKDSYHTGTVLRDKNITISYCYSSPALRCLQTAAKILEGLQLHNKLKIRIEPGLFECTGWYTASETSNVLTMPRFMTKKELLENKYAIDKQYHEQMTIGDISRLETELEFYQRSHNVTETILKIHESEYIGQIQQGQVSSHQQMHVLFIAHAPNLETCTRKLCGGKFRPDTLPHVIRNVDFLTMTVIEKTNNDSEKWIFRRSSFYGDEF